MQYVVCIVFFGRDFNYNIIGNFMIYLYRIETHLLQLFAHSENSERFYI